MNETFMEAIDAWKEIRLGKFTASEMHRIMQEGKNDEPFGQGAITYINKKVAEILTQEAKEVEGIRAVEWGFMYEAEAVRAYEEFALLSVTHYGSFNPVFYPISEYSGGSPDGLDNLGGVVEIKCPDSHTHVSFLKCQTGEDLKILSKEYYTQIQTNILATEMHCGVFVSYDPRQLNDSLKLKVIEVERDQEFINLILKRIDLAEQELIRIIKMLMP